jgi:hypothetical protein
VNVLAQGFRTSLEFRLPESSGHFGCACFLAISVSERGAITLFSPEEVAKIEMARQLFGDKITGWNSPEVQVAPQAANRTRGPCGPISPESPFRITWDVIGACQLSCVPLPRRPVGQGTLFHHRDRITTVLRSDVVCRRERGAYPLQRRLSAVR